MRKKRNYHRRLTDAQRKRKIRRNIRLGLLILLVLAVLFEILRIVKPAWFTDEYVELKGKDIDAARPDIDVELLTVNRIPGRERRRRRLQALSCTIPPIPERQPWTTGIILKTSKTATRPR